MRLKISFLSTLVACTFLLIFTRCLGQSGPVVVSGRKIPDVVLTDQHGKRVHIYSDLMKGKVVAINTIFTTCTTICPMNGMKFSELSRLLDNDIRGRVSLISITVDPLVDTPQRLDDWSHQFGASGPEWTLLTGPKDDVEQLLKALQIFNGDKLNHSPDFLLGGEGMDTWARPSSSYTVPQLADLIRSRLKQTANYAQARH